MKELKIKRFGFFFILMTLAVFIFAPYGKAARKTTVKVKNKTIYVNGTYTVRLKNKLKSARYYYSSGKISVAKVNSKGVITGRNKGTAKIKVRYSYKKKVYYAGQITVSVRKSSIRSDKYSQVIMTNTVLRPSDYLNSPNKNASYSIDSTSPESVYGDNSGNIHAIKAGSSTLTIKENYGGKSRNLGKISISVRGATLPVSTIEMSYNSTYDLSRLLQNKVANATYSLVSSNPDIIATDGLRLISGGSPGYQQSCTVQMYETIDDTPRLINSITINIIVTAFVSPDTQNLKVGMGSTLRIGSEDGVKLENADPNATYELVSLNTNIISENLTAISYGTATLQVIETSLTRGTSTLSTKVNVTVGAATVLPELYSNGYDIYLSGDDRYSRYPISCRDHTKTYYYESSDNSICGAGTGGNDKGMDYLVLHPKKPGKVTIYVYEYDKSKRTVGSFIVYVHE